LIPSFDFVCDFDQVMSLGVFFNMEKIKMTPHCLNTLKTEDTWCLAHHKNRHTAIKVHESSGTRLNTNSQTG